MIDRFINLINSKLGCAYIWGGQNDEILTNEKLDLLMKTFGQEHYITKNFDARKWIGRKGYYDCSGLVCFCLQSLGLITKGSDYTASTLYSQLCTPVTKAELKTGDLCFNKSTTGIVHVGVYMGNNRVTHARGTFYGVCNTELFNSFNTFGRLKCFKEEMEKPVVIDELKEALTFLSKKAGIDYTVWYKVAKDVRYLDKCFIKIANAWKKVG